jgi:hypothetical protein
VFRPDGLEPSCAKTVPKPYVIAAAGAYFEQEADPPKLLKTLKTESKDGVSGVPEGACKAGALPAERDGTHHVLFPRSFRVKTPSCLKSPDFQSLRSPGSIERLVVICQQSSVWSVKRT